MPTAFGMIYKFKTKKGKKLFEDIFEKGKLSRTKFTTEIVKYGFFALFKVTIFVSFFRILKIKKGFHQFFSDFSSKR
jgi:hypothetical protein